MVGDVEEAISECLRIVHMDKYLNLHLQTILYFLVIGTGFIDEIDTNLPVVRVNGFVVSDYSMPP